MKILVTGAKGMLGTDLIKVLEDKFDVVGVDVDDFDITDRTRVIESLAKINPDLVVHSAAYTNVDDCEEHRELAYRVNGDGAGYIAEACREVKAKMVFISTDFVFNGQKKAPYLETDQPAPLGVYGKSKLEGEKKVQQLLDNYLIVRTAWLFGKNGHNFVKTIIKATEEREILRVVDDQVGSPTYTLDLAKAIRILIEKDLKGIFNVTNSGFCSWYEFACEIIKIAEIKKVKVITITSKELNRPAERPSFSILDKAKFEQQTGAGIRFWKEALADYFKEL